MHTRVLIFLLATLVLVAPAYAKPTTVKVTVAEPYIEMRTGPGQGYPVFHVADRGAAIEVLRRRTTWFEVRTERGVKGWVDEEHLSRTLQADGAPLAISRPGRDDFEGRHWEAYFSLGDFDGASSISLTGAWRMSTNLAVELQGVQITGNYSDGWMAGVRLVHTPFPGWRIAPYLLLGTGVISISPRSSLVTTEDRTDQYAQAGFGLRAYLTRRFMFRAEYTGDIVFTSRDDNQEVEEWKAGFAFFF